MNFIELIKDTDIKLLSETEICDITGISSDSRDIKAGNIFVCICGLNFDGHEYIAQAVERGASVIIVDSEHAKNLIEKSQKEGTPPIPAPAIMAVSENTRRALAFLWDAWYGHPSAKMKLYAVTGTNGKTSVTFMLRSIFKAAMMKTGLIGTVVCYSDERRLDIRSENERANMTTPDPKELYKMLSVMASEGVEAVCLEATSHALAFDKLAPLRFEVGIFTNLTPEHLDFHGNMENYLAAKKRLFSMCKSAIINGDDTYGNEMRLAAEAGGCRRVCVCSCEESNGGDYTAVDIKNLGVNGIEYMLSSVCSVFRVKSLIPGRFTVSNTLEAAACAMEVGIPAQTIQDALRHMGGIDGRFERVKLCTGADFSVFIDYAHTPDALENLLKTVRGFRCRGQRIVLVFGCGGDRDKSKRAIMGSIASSLADFVIVTSDNSRNENPLDIISDIMAGFDYTRAHATIIENRAEAIDYAIRNALDSDIILLAGKGHEAYEIDRDGKHPFNEKIIAQEAARKYYYFK